MAKIIPLFSGSKGNSYYIGSGAGGVLVDAGRSCKQIENALADNNIDAMKKYLDGCQTGNTRFDGAEGIQAIEASGGIPVWAHPLGGEGEKHLSPDEFYKKFDIMKSFGIKGLECYYSRYNLDEIKFLVDLSFILSINFCTILNLGKTISINVPITDNITTTATPVAILHL